MKVTALFAAFALFLLSLPAFACGKDGKNIFSCTTTTGKRVEVCELSNGKAFSYAFGKSIAKPELRLLAPRSKVGYMNSSGASGYIINLEFQNGRTRYSVERGWSAGQGPYGALTVFRDEKPLASLECDLSTLNESLGALDLPVASER